MTIQGTRCTFDYSRRPDRGDFAASVVAYVDQKVPVLFNAVGVPIPGDRVQIRFADRNGGAFIGPNVIELQDNHLPDDLGCLIHECVHWTQLPVGAVYAARAEIFEGVADYYRITLSTDHQGDYFNNEKQNLVQVFNANRGHPSFYESVSEFIAYLRRDVGDAQFVRQLNDELRSNSVPDIDHFFQHRFGRSYYELLAEYPGQRTAIVGLHPENANRYDFFTTMP